MRVIKKILSLTKKGWHNRDSYLLAEPHSSVGREPEVAGSIPCSANIRYEDW